jgi:hypothetical protein
LRVFTIYGGTGDIIKAIIAEEMGCSTAFSAGVPGSEWSVGPPRRECETVWPATRRTGVHH